MNKIAVFGASGLLGINWCIQKSNDFEITAVCNKRNINLSNIKTEKLEQHDLTGLNDIINVIEPDIIINAAGLTSVEECEKNKELAYETNVSLPKNLAEICSSNNIQFAHISTDHLFNGESNYIDEETPPEPQNYYASTKAESEIVVQEHYPEALIIRANFFGWGPTYRKSFSDFIIESVLSHKKITLFEDVYYTPIFISHLIELTHKLLVRNANGVYNLCSDNRLSKHDFGLSLVEKFGLNSNYILAGRISNNKKLVLRPNEMSLSNNKVSAFLQEKIGTVKDNIAMLYNSQNTIKKIVDTV